MGQHICDIQVAAIAAAVRKNGLDAKRGKLDKDEIIIGVGSDVPGAKTVKLAYDSNDRPTWYIAYFFQSTPKDISEVHDLGDTPIVKTAHYWADMLKLLN